MVVSCSFTFGEANYNSLPCRSKTNHERSTGLSDSVAVVQRFGKLHAQKEPGLHLKIPFGIDAIHIVPTKRQLKQEFGFATASATNPDQGSRGDYALRETQMVTGDLNAAL
jgi:membrane protease subunit HflK